MAYDLLAWKAWAANATTDEIAEMLAQKSEAVRVLANECGKAKAAFPNHADVHSLAMNVNWPNVHAYNAACCETDRNPIAAEAVRKAGG